MLQEFTFVTGLVKSNSSRRHRLGGAALCLTVCPEGGTHGGEPLQRAGQTPSETASKEGIGLCHLGSLNPAWATHASSPIRYGLGGEVPWVWVSGLCYAGGQPGPVRQGGLLAALCWLFVLETITDPGEAGGSADETPRGHVSPISPLPGVVISTQTSGVLPPEAWPGP